MATLKSAESRMCEKALARGVAGGEPPVGELNADGPLPDCSVSAAARALAGWQANSPAQLAAEFFMCGRPDTSSNHVALHYIQVQYTLQIITLSQK